MAVEATVANGYPLGRPVDREADALDTVIRRAIEKLPMETRLYPDVYAWQVTDAVKRALREEEGQPTVKELFEPTPMGGELTTILDEMRGDELTDAELTDIFNDRTLGAPIERLREIGRRAAQRNGQDVDRTAT